MIRFVASIPLLFAAAMPVFADAGIEEKFQALLAKLADDAWAVREQAEQDLVALGPEARALIEREIGQVKDAEVRMRLKNALSEIGKPQWATGIKAAMELAVRAGKPILLVCADGALEAPRSRAGEALRREISNPDLANALNARFVLLWWNAEVAGAPDDRDPKAAPTEEGDTGPTGMIGLYFCTAKGVVRHFLPGWWSSATIREDIDRLQPVFAASDSGECLKARTAQVRLLEASNEKKASENPDELAKPLKDSEIRREVERNRKVISAYRTGDDVVGEGSVEGFLNQRMRDLRQRWGEAQRER
ncbi:MAG: hypothetical protein FD180_554 [Planctomycetota bacterium]|nr:MAG: hypothetical protein FD180_554 [Planctomycetota bacterium]